MFGYSFCRYRFGKVVLNIVCYGEDLIEEGVRSLNRLRNKLAEKKQRKSPLFYDGSDRVRTIIQRPDGIYVVTIKLFETLKSNAK